MSTTFIAFFFAFSLYFSVTCKRQEDILALITMPNSCLSLYLILKREIFSSLITFQDTILSWQASSGILFYVSVSRKDTFQEIVSPFIHLQSRPIEMRPTILYLANHWTEFEMLLTPLRFLYLVMFSLLAFPSIPQFIAHFLQVS